MTRITSGLLLIAGPPIWTLAPPGAEPLSPTPGTPCGRATMRRATASDLAPADRVTHGGTASAADTLGTRGHLLGPATAPRHRDTPELLGLDDVIRDERPDFARAALLAQFLLDCVDAPRLIGRRVDDPRLAVHADAVQRPLFPRLRFVAPQLERLGLRSPWRWRGAPRGWVSAPCA